MGGDSQLQGISAQGRESTRLTTAGATRLDIRGASAMLATLALYEVLGSCHVRRCSHLACRFATNNAETRVG